MGVGWCWCRCWCRCWCFRRGYGRGSSIQSVQGTMSQSWTLSPTRSLRRSTCHSVYILIVARIAALCPSPLLPGSASSRLRQIPTAASAKMKQTKATPTNTHKWRGSVPRCLESRTSTSTAHSPPSPLREPSCRVPQDPIGWSTEGSGSGR